jgi:hypothetical protein
VFTIPTTIELTRADSIQITALSSDGLNSGLSTSVNKSLPDVLTISARNCLMNQSEACNRVAGLSTTNSSLV